MAIFIGEHIHQKWDCDIKTNFLVNQPVLIGEHIHQKWDCDTSPVLKLQLQTL